MDLPLVAFLPSAFVKGKDSSDIRTFFFSNFPYVLREIFFGIPVLSPVKMRGDSILSEVFSKGGCTSRIDRTTLFRETPFSPPLKCAGLPPQ